MKRSDISVLFFGSPEFALPSLQNLHEEDRITIKGVITQPDQPSGRGHKMQTPPVGRKARELGLPIFQPKTLAPIDWGTYPPLPNSEEESVVSFCNFLGTIEKPDFLVVVAYGKLLPEAMLGMPKIDSLNVHPSMLPRWRGAAPLPHTIFAGDQETGVCIIKLIKELDAGPIYTCRKFPVAPTETLETLHTTCANTGATLLKDTIIEIIDSDLHASPQINSGVTYAKKWSKEDCIINWSEPGTTTLQRIRACAPKPGARSRLHDKDFKIIAAKEAELTIQDTFPKEPCTLFKLSETQLGVRTGDGKIIELEVVQLAGKKAMTVKDFLKGIILGDATRLE